MSVEDKRRAFLESKLADIQRVQEDGFALLRLVGRCAQEDEDTIAAAHAVFANAELPRDKAKLEHVWIEFQAQCLYWAYQYVDGFCKL
jgi:hypothetical protein